MQPELKARDERWFTLTSIFHTWFCPAIFIMSLESEVNGFVLRCISCTDCLAFDVVREEKLDGMERIAGGLFCVLSTLKR
jgi:nucleoside recognition membrane protein YjiH